MKNGGKASKVCGVSPRPGRALPFLLADGCYLALLFGWMLTMRPTGGDFALVAHPDALFPFPRTVFEGMVHLFQDWVPGYLLVNFVLLYGCMALILLLTRLLTGGPWWLGSVAAVLFMANPVKTEAVLSLGGIGDLLPALLGLSLLSVYALCRTKQRPIHYWLPPLAYLSVILVSPSNITVAAVILVMERCCFRNTGNGGKRRWLPITLIGVAALLVSGQAAMPESLSLRGMLAPLALVLYPIGFLPKTVLYFTAHPLLGYAYGAALAITLFLLARKSCQTAVAAGFLGAAAFRLFQGGYWTDPVTLENSGRLLIPAALASIAVAGFFLALLENAHWRASVVRMSTLVCILAMASQTWVNLQWYRAGREVDRFRQTAAASAAENPHQPLAILPDVQYVGLAPYKLSDSIRYTTCFGKAIPAIPLARLSVQPPLQVDVRKYDSRGASFSIAGLPESPGILPHIFDSAWWWQRAKPSKPCLFNMQAGETPYPAIRIPFP